MTIGYVGLGAMGGALAGRLVGHSDLLVWDLNPAAVEDFVARGAKAAASLADLGSRCEIVLLCLPKSANVGQALFGGNGLAASLAPGSVLVDQTSGVPQDSRSFADQLTKRGVTLIDAPVAGGVPSAVAGQITIMASGPGEAFERVRSVLLAISPKVYHCSDQVGDGQAVKSINNLINAAYRMATLEIFAIGRRLGLAAGEMTDALNSGPARSFVSGRLLPAVVERRSSSDFTLTLMVKDLNQAAELGISSGVPMPISDTARGMMNAALNLLGDDSRLDDVVPFIERLTQTDLAGEHLSSRETATLQWPRAEAMELVTGAVAICNRAIMLENIALAMRAGLKVDGFAPVISNGSAASEQADRLFAAIRGEGGSADEPIGSALEVMTKLARIGADLGMPLQMANQVRAHLLGVVDRLGASADVADLIKPYAPAAD